MAERGQGTGSAAGRVALVTGGGRGIGRAIALGLAEDGFDVAVNYRRDEAAAQATVADIEAGGRRAKAYAASVDDAEADRAMVEAVLDDLGSIDALVHNGGIASRGLPVADTDPEELERVVRTHALGPHHLTRLALPSLRARAAERGRADVVVVSSVAAQHLSAGGAPYNMGKAALEALAMTLAKEERARGIHVNVVAPGLVATDMGDRLARAVLGVASAIELDGASPFGRVCRPEDVADVVRYLVSDAAGYLTGQRLTVDGGGPLTGARA